MNTSQNLGSYMWLHLGVSYTKLEVLDGFPHISGTLKGMPKSLSPISPHALTSLNNLAWAALNKARLLRGWKGKLQKTLMARSGGHTASPLPHSIGQN